ncbi:MAG: hypothetical protein FWE40_00160 [Oscillospiraceae bacterium]|nr:hypothetical protein [Oscillospiraceae bacterium]
MATTPCVSPQTSTNLSGAISFGAPDSTCIPFQVSASDITEENVITSALFTYPCTVGDAVGYALCLRRGQPLPHACGSLPESQVLANPQTARAVRFVVGQLAQSPNYDFDDPQALRIRALLQRGFELWNEGIFGNHVMLYLTDVGGVTPGIPPAQLAANSFAGPWNTWDAQGMAQVALWFLLGQFPPDGKLTFLDGAGNLMNAENRFRLFNGYTMLHLMAQAYARGELNCEGDMPISPLQFSGPQTTFTLPSCAREVAVGPFMLNGCEDAELTFLLSSGVATSDAAGLNEIAGAPMRGQPFWIRVHPQSSPASITMQASAQVTITQPIVHYFGTQTQTMALVHGRDDEQEFHAQHTITLDFARNDDEDSEAPPCEPCFIPQFIPRPFPVPCASPPLAVSSNNNNNNNNNSNNNNMVNQMLQNMQANMVMQFLQRQPQMSAPCWPQTQWPC